MEGWQEIDRYFILYAGTLGMLILFLGVLLLFKAYHKKILAAQIEQNRQEIAYRDELLYSNIRATEAERARIARDLHDEVSVSLSLVKMDIKRTAPDLFGTVKHTIDNTIESVRRIAYDLLPPALEAFGIVAAVQAFFEKTAQDAGIVVYFNTEEEHTRFNPLIELSVFRILQELYHNTIRHAAATIIEISLQMQNETLSVIYYDNGKGYDPQQLLYTGMGLKNIHARARQCGGDVAYKNTSDGKVQVHISIPAMTTGNV